MGDLAADERHDFENALEAELRRAVRLFRSHRFFRLWSLWLFHSQFTSAAPDSSGPMESLGRITAVPIASPSRRTRHRRFHCK